MGKGDFLGEEDRKQVVSGGMEQKGLEVKDGKESGAWERISTKDLGKSHMEMYYCRSFLKTHRQTPPTHTQVKLHCKWRR